MGREGVPGRTKFEVRTRYITTWSDEVCFQGGMILSSSSHLIGTFTAGTLCSRAAQPIMQRLFEAVGLDNV